MGTEIERKFLVVGEAWRALSQPTFLRQGYLSTDRDRTVRVRRAGKAGTITVKGASRGATRSEFEYAIPVADADQMIDGFCIRPIIEKNRHEIPMGAVTWEVDEFLGVNRGLVVAEIELRFEDQRFSKPDWIGKEVTDDPRYFNANLVTRPFSTW